MSENISHELWGLRGLQREDGQAVDFLYAEALHSIMVGYYQRYAKEIMSDTGGVCPLSVPIDVFMTWVLHTMNIFNLHRSPFDGNRFMAHADIQVIFTRWLERMGIIIEEKRS